MLRHGNAGIDNDYDRVSIAVTGAAEERAPYEMKKRGDH